MKKLFAFLLAVLMLAAMTACAPKQPVETQPETQAASTPETTEATETTGAAEEGAFAFMFENTTLTPGEKFDAATLPEATSVFEVPSCAIEGTDNVYDYQTVEVTVFDNGTAPTIYSIYLKDPNTATVEGLYQGDDLAAVENLYGTEYETNGSELIYTKGNTQLRIIVENGFVISIEYRMVVK